jgi:anti-sigma-K factor RskA
MSAIMIPDDPEEISALAGEYVLGLLEPDEAREIEQALPANDALRGAVAFWENRLQPLSALAPAVDPPAGTWDRISAKVGSGAQSLHLPSWWNKPEPWRWATAGFAAAAAAMLLVVARPITSPHYIAVLNAPGQQTASFVVMGGHKEIVARAAGAAPPEGRAFELWAIYPNVSRPQALGVIPASGVLRVKDFPTELLADASLAVSVEPPGGSPTGQPTGPVVFIGKLRTL